MAKHREKMQDIRESLMKLGLLINNENVPAADAGTFTRNSPTTGEAVTTAAAARAADVDAAVRAAAEAFASWSTTGPGQRRTILNACADALEARSADFAALGMKETGGTAPWFGFNVMLAAGMLREAAAMTTQIKGEVIPSDKPGTLAMSCRQPVGVLVGMAPWNAPVILGVRSFAMPVACGNTVVMKASEKCPGLHRLIGDCMIAGGLPKGVLNIVTHSAEGAPEVVNALIDHPLTRRINFTGSTRVGRLIAERAARHLKPCLLELSGKAPLVVLEDADIPAAVNAATFGAFLNQGQICMSTEKIVLVEAIADEFAAAFVTKTASLRAGGPDEQAQLGSVVDRDVIDRLAGLIDAAVSAGARLLAGGAPDEGTIMSPTIVADVTAQMEIYAAETFGPVATLIRARDEDHAVEIANDTQYGLSAAVFSRDVRRGLEVARRLQTGIVHVNGPTVADEAQMPFGGTKASGYGRFGGSAAINEFTELRWITIEDPDQQYPF